MSTMNNGTTWNDTVTVSKQAGTKVTIDTDQKYIEKDIELTINVQAGSAATPNTAITANPTLNVNSTTGVVTANVSATKSVSPVISSGFVSTGTAGTVSVSGSKTLSLSTQAAQTITPGTTNQTIAAGKYLTGTQTIAGDSNLVAENIRNGVSIFGVSGNCMTNVILGQDINGRIIIPTTTSNVTSLVLQEKTVIPTAAGLSVQPETGYDGLSRVNVAGDANLIADNIVEGVSIFGVTGTHSGGGRFEEYECTNYSYVNVNGLNELRAYFPTEISISFMNNLQTVVLIVLYGITVESHGYQDTYEKMYCIYNGYSCTVSGHGPFSLSTSTNNYGVVNNGYLQFHINDADGSTSVVNVDSIYFLVE